MVDWLFGTSVLTRISQIGIACFKNDRLADSWVAVQRNYYKRPRFPIGRWGKPYIIAPSEFNGSPCSIEVELDNSRHHRLGIEVIDDSGLDIVYQ